MAFGLEVLDENGVVTLDLRHRYMRLHSSIRVPLPAYPFIPNLRGSVPPPLYATTVPGMTQDGTWVVLGTEYYRSNRLTIRVGVGEIILSPGYGDPSITHTILVFRV